MIDIEHKLYITIRLSARGGISKLNMDIITPYEVQYWLWECCC